MMIQYILRREPRVHLKPFSHFSTLVHRFCPFQSIRRSSVLMPYPICTFSVISSTSQHVTQHSTKARKIHGHPPINSNLICNSYQTMINCSTWNALPNFRMNCAVNIHIGLLILCMRVLYFIWRETLRWVSRTEIDNAHNVINATQFHRILSPDKL